MEKPNFWRLFFSIQSLSQKLHFCAFLVGRSGPSSFEYPRTSPTPHFSTIFSLISQCLSDVPKLSLFIHWISLLLWIHVESLGDTPQGLLEKNQLCLNPAQVGLGLGIFTVFEIKDHLEIITFSNICGLGALGPP